VVAAARRIVDGEGVDRLTMRRLATEIGSTPMALYHHVRDKEELLVLLLDDYATRALRRPELPARPRERIVVAAAAIHEALAACPWIAEVLTADDLMSASALWFVEQIVDGLVECGLTPERAVHGYRAIWYYTAGEIVVRATAARRRADDDRPTYREQVFARLDPDELPRLAQVADRWAPLTAEDTYLDGLRALVDGLLATR
jgi:AcrR family transcriptional regulator